MTPVEKLTAMKEGRIVITSDEEMDEMLKLEDEEIYEVRSIPNPRRLGLRDQYIAWIGEADRPFRPD